MATAETQKLSKQDEVARGEGELASGMGERDPSRSQRPTRQLDFTQAMSDFHQMFPTMDNEVIEAVLRANDGAVDATIDQLLTMSIDVDEVAINESIALSALEQSYNESLEDNSPSEDSPPSYSEAMRTHLGGEQSIWTTPIMAHSTTSSSKTVPKRNFLDLDIDELSLSNTELKSPSGSSGFGSPLFSRQNSDNTPRKVEYRNWNPPMLGTLPEDFLRIRPVSPASPSWGAVGNSVVDGTHFNLRHDSKAKVHRSHRSKSERHLRPSATSGKEVTKSSSSEKKHKKASEASNSEKSEKMSRSQSTVEKSSRNNGLEKASKSHRKERSSSRKEHLVEWTPPQQQSAVFPPTREFGSDLLHERMRENERRRKRASLDMDPEVAQYLEDERLAILLQNSEFLQELRGDEDFMNTLQRDRMNASAFEPVTFSAPEPLPTQPLPTQPLPTPPDEKVHQGYGSDNQNTLDAFPFSKSVPGEKKDDDAELRRQLGHMGKASKKQFAALARKFFSRRKKKTPKQIMNQKLAPSMMNLLDNEDNDEEDEEDPLNNTPYNQSKESDLVSVPSHRTVQRPPYHPGMVVTDFNQRTTDMV